MKVLDLINTSESAKELLMDRCLHLQRTYGIENHILCSSGPYVSVLRAKGLTVQVVDTPRGLQVAALAVSLLRLLRVLRRERYDIIHSHGSVLGLLARAARPFIRARVIHTVHGFHFHEDMRGPARWVYEGSERALLRLTHVVLSQNLEDLETLRAWSRNAQIEHIGNGVRIPERQFEYRASPNAPYKLCSIARFEPIKNHDLLLRVFRATLDLGIDAELVCLGNGELLEASRRLARELEIGDRVVFPGYVDDVFEYLQDVDLHVLTSVKEGLPRALIETMAVGIPSVATDVKGSREVISECTGILVPPGDVARFAEAVAFLLQDPQRRAAMSSAGRRRVMERYDERLICDRLFELYQGII